MQFKASILSASNAFFTSFYALAMLTLALINVQCALNILCSLKIAAEMSTSQTEHKVPFQRGKFSHCRRS